MHFNRLSGTVALVLILSLGWGCATGPSAAPSLGSIHPGWDVIYRPVPHPEKSIQDVQDDLKRVLLNTNPQYPTVGNTGMTFFPSGFQVQAWAEGQPKLLTLYNYQLAKPEIVVERDGRGAMRTLVSSDIQFNNTKFGDAKIVADCLFYLQGVVRGIVAAEERRQVEFKPIAERYRALTVKPPLPEELRRWVVQAEASREEKKYDKAIEQYQKVVAADPVVYPEAYYNMALLAEQSNRLVSAMYFMKSYLQLRPDAPDARGARDKIYAWEMKMGIE
jgi:tetratricopeptide (TPR) repeat protein